ncbi:MAG: PEGA domain-containing protein [Deltaproteobacteria bacterium]|nr:MAG: PEGA domain-containing protein [Deltaproteobacteria bacterium]
MAASLHAPRPAGLHLPCMWRLWRGAALCVVLGLCASARAETLVVLDPKAGPGIRNLGRVVAERVVRQAQAMGMEVLGPHDLESTLGWEAYKALVDCGPDAACLGAGLASIAADRVVAGTFDRNATHYRVRLALIDLHSGRTVATLTRDVLIASRHLREEVDAGLPALLRGEPEAMGVLVVRSTVDGSKVVVDGEERGTLDIQGAIRVELPPGKHAVTVTARDHLPLERFVVVEPEQETVFVAELFEIPGLKKALVAKPKEQPPPAPELRMPWYGWATLGAGAVAVGTGAYFGLSARDVMRRARDQDADGVLDLTRTEALAGRDAATAANLMYGLAGATVVAAALMAVLAPEEIPPPTAAPAGSAPAERKDAPPAPPPGAQPEPQAKVPAPSAGVGLVPGGGVVFVEGRF